MAKEAETEDFPVLSFYFHVKIADMAFLVHEVSGLGGRLEVEQVIEGGNNAFTHRLPTRVQYDNLKLIGGILPDGGSQEIFEWISNCLMEQTVSDGFHELHQDIIITLLNPANQDEVISWTVINAFPVRWSGPSFNAQENKLALLELELCYQRIILGTSK